MAAKNAPTGPSGLPGLSGADPVSAGIGAAAQLAEAVASVGMWWETRQHRLMEAASFEEERRIPWTADMMSRWVLRHQDSDLLDLRLSGFLARETAATMEAIADSKKMAVPQALLYDLDLIRDTISAGRRLLHDQLMALNRNSDEYGIHLNMQFVDRLGEDPIEEWRRRTKDRATGTFDGDLRDVVQDREGFLQLLLNDERSRAVVEDSRGGLLADLASRLLTIPAWSRSLVNFNRDAAGPRRDEFRELVLFSAEVTRATALHSAWGIVDSITRERLGTELYTVEIRGALDVRDGGPPSQLSRGSERRVPAIERAP